MAPKRKGGNRRQKTAIQRIEKKDARQVCFAKRRQGLFNKATELAVMCGANVAVVAFSPGDKAFSFGHPSTETVIDRFMAGSGEGVLSATDNNKLKKLHLQHDELRTQLKDVKGRKKCVEDAMEKERAVGDQIAVWLNLELGDVGEEQMAAFIANLMMVRAAVSERANQVLLNLGMENVFRILQVPVPLQPQQLFGGSTFEFGSSSGANTGMEIQQMRMEMPLTQGFSAGMDMHHMLMAMPPSSDLAYGIDMQQILMPIPLPSGFGAGMEMQQMVMVMSPQPESVVGAEKQPMIMPMSPPPEFCVGMEMPPPMGIAAETEIVKQGPGPNMEFSY